jgi:hypothetical protein
VCRRVGGDEEEEEEKRVALCGTRHQQHFAIAVAFLVAGSLSQFDFEQGRAQLNQQERANYCCFPLQFTPTLTLHGKMYVIDQI